MGGEAVVVGAGPNGLAAAIALARAGLPVRVLEAADEPGGGVRSAELTRPGFVHDLCSAVHPLGRGSPYLRRLPLADHGLRWIEPDAPFGHALAPGRAVVVERSLDATVERLEGDGPRWRRLFAPLLHDADAILEHLLGPFRLPWRHPVALARAGARAVWPATRLVEAVFSGSPARAAFAGAAAHGMLPLDRSPSAGFGVMLALLAHHVGWPLPAGGAGRVAAALATHLRSLGGEVATAHRVHDLAEVEGRRPVLLDVTPRQLLSIAGDRLPAGYRRRLERYRYGPGAFKVDWALSEPIPWAAPELARAATVHVGGSYEEVVASEHAVGQGRPPERPFVLLVQPTLFDPTRAPAGHHTAWAYCHVPNGCDLDMTERIEAQIERFAPGFRDVVLERHVMSPADLEARNPNLVGGDINGGIQDLRQLWTRPVGLLHPYRTPLRGVYLCSASTPPGGGVHGMCGYHAARTALSDLGLAAGSEAE